MGVAHGHDIHKPDGSFSTIVSYPEAPVVTVADMKAHLRIDTDDEDTLIGDYITAATDMVDAEFGELGRALITQRWQLTMPKFPADGHVDLPIPPVQQVFSITYYDTDNVQQTLSTDVYRLTLNTDMAYLDLVAGQTWPATYDRADAVAIQYDTGFGDAGTDVPEGIRQAIRMMVAHWYEHREAATEARLMDTPIGIRSLLMKYRVTRGHI